MGCVFCIQPSFFRVRRILNEREKHTTGIALPKTNIHWLSVETTTDRTVLYAKKTYYSKKHQLVRDCAKFGNPRDSSPLSADFAVFKGYYSPLQVHKATIPHFRLSNNHASTN